MQIYSKADEARRRKHISRELRIRDKSTIRPARLNMDRERLHLHEIIINVCLWEIVCVYKSKHLNKINLYSSDQKLTAKNPQISLKTILSWTAESVFVLDRFPWCSAVWRKEQKDPAKNSLNVLSSFSICKLKARPNIALYALLNRAHVKHSLIIRAES